MTAKNTGKQRAVVKIIFREGPPEVVLETGAAVVVEALNGPNTLC